MYRRDLTFTFVVVGCYGDDRYYGFTVETSLGGEKWDMVADRRVHLQASTTATN